MQYASTIREGMGKLELKTQLLCLRLILVCLSYTMISLCIPTYDTCRIIQVRKKIVYVGEGLVYSLYLNYKGLGSTTKIYTFELHTIYVGKVWSQIQL